MTRIQASKLSNEKKSFQIFKTIEKKLEPKFKLEQLVRSLDNKKIFSKGYSKNFSCKLYTVSEVIHDTIPSYRINYLPETYNKNLKGPTKLSLEENNQVMRNLNLIK